MDRSGSIGILEIPLRFIIICAFYVLRMRLIDYLCYNLAMKHIMLYNQKFFNFLICIVIGDAAEIALFH
jgi:hypothetical protein